MRHGCDEVGHGDVSSLGLRGCYPTRSKNDEARDEQADGERERAVREG